MADNEKTVCIFSNVLESVKSMSKEELQHRLDNTQNKVFTNTIENACDLLGFYQSFFSKESHYQFDTELVNKVYGHKFTFDVHLHRKIKVAFNSEKEGLKEPSFNFSNTAPMAA